MTANPIMAALPPRSGKVTKAMLEELADSLNRSRFVIDSGLPYFVNKRPDEKVGVLHFLDRRVSTPKPIE
jgi:6-phosphogluconate dehydrogenase (decarboxylating)